ncbi:MAG: hypothetical protein AAGH46_10650 [Bacteroidota bacterium]
MNKVIALGILICLMLQGTIYGQDDQYQGNQPAFYPCSEPMEIDDSIIKEKSDNLYFHFLPDRKPRSFTLKGFNWYQHVPPNYFPAFLVNTTDYPFFTEMQDGSLMIIQEALDEEGVWKPIEYWIFSGCGNSYNFLKLAPGKCVMVPVKKYAGEFQTKIRLKFKTPNGLIYSEPFEGSIEKSQFAKEINTVNGILYRGPANYFDEK